MNHSFSESFGRVRTRGFTLVEMLVVVAIIAILMTAGAIGLGNLGGRGVTSGVDSAEAIFDEARSLAIAENARTAVLISRQLTNNSAEDRRRILVVREVLPVAKTNNVPVAAPTWELISRGTLLPEKTFFSDVYSQPQGANLATIAHSRIQNSKAAHQGDYYIYQFSSQGILWEPDSGVDNPDNALESATFVIGSGTRNLTKTAQEAPPKVVGPTRRDFGGFKVWKSGRSSLFRSPDQISPAMANIQPGDTF